MRNTAFSVVEVIVIVAVVSLLAALLMPAVQSVRERAGLVGCLNNLKQLGFAFQSYASDHEGYLPRTETPAPSGVGTVVWPHHVAPYLESDFSRVQADEALARKSPFICPAERELVKPYITYAINRQLREIGGAGEMAYIKQTAIRSPSKYAVLSDAYKSFHQYNDRARKLRDWNFLDRRHGGKPNILYADWHAAPLGEEIVGLNDPDGNSPFYQSLWLYDK